MRNTPRRFGKLIASGTVFCALTLALSACSLTVNTGSGTESSSSSSTSSASDTHSTSTAPDPASEAEAAATGTPDEVAANDILTVHQGEYSHTCSGSALTIEGQRATVLVSGDCTSVTDNTTNATVKIDKTSALTVTGTHGTVIVEDVGQVTVSGSKNTIKWRSGNPAVDNSGAHNKVIQMN